MSFRNRSSFLSIMVVLTFALSAVMTIPVYADGGDNPPVETPEQIEPEQVTGTEEADQTPLESVAVTEASDLPETLNTILADVPEGTELVILDENGESIPLVTQEAAQAVVVGDPVWCPAGLAIPTPGLGGCTNAFPSFAALVTELTTAGGLVTNPGMDGIIWIASNYALTNDNSAITLDGGLVALNQMTNFKLTLKGGWCDGSDLTCTGLIDPTKPSTLDVALNILNWNNDVTLSDIVVASATGTYAINVGTTKNITFTNVQSNNNSGSGAHLDNDGSGTGNVTVTNSQFKSNTGTYGLLVESNGTITLKDVTATSNTNGFGAWLDNDALSAPKAITLNGTNTFSNNGTNVAGSGLYITSRGQITLNNIIAANNGKAGTGYGAEIHNDVGSSVSGVTLTGTNIFTDNQSNGLYLASFGAIKLNNVYALSNNNMGAQLVNSGAATMQAVTLTGTNEFSYNTIFGLAITSKGQITINNVSANSNGQTGASLNNYMGAPLSTMGITLTGTNFFNLNGFGGLNVQSNGTVLLNSITANGNGTTGSGTGVAVANGAAISLKAVTISGTNSFNGNYNDGLYVTSSGVITLSNITANGSLHGTGAILNNIISGPSVPKPVSLSGTNTFTSNNQDGLAISTYGLVLTNNITASNNGNYGASITNSGATLPQTVTMNGLNKFNDNTSDGLNIVSKGAILTNSVTAIGNDQYGVVLQNTAGSATSKVTMTGTNLLTGNNQTNLSVQSIGMIIVNNITANGSTLGYGAQLQNTASSSAGITLTGSNFFNSNFLNGLLVTSNGAITASNLTASNNGSGGGQAGAFLNNSASAAKAGVTLSGVNTFNDNSGGSDGLRIWSLGNVSVNSVTASSNANSGASIGDSSFTTAIGSVTLTGSNVFALNSDDNLYIYAAGIVTLNNINSSGAAGSGSGAYIDNTLQGVLKPKTVTLNGTNVFSGNAGIGFRVNSYGLITVNNVTANSNLQEGVYLNNSGASTPAGVTLIGANSFGSNTLDGLYIDTKGLITSAGIVANNNGNRGAALSATAGVKLNGSNSFSTNVNGGLSVTSNGVITINNLVATLSSGGYGAALNNLGTPTNAAAPKGITLSGTNNISGNRTDGLLIDTYGSVLINNLTANDNGISSGVGADIDNNAPSATIAANVTLTGTNTFIGNYAQGLLIDSFGTITINNLTAKDSFNSKGAELKNQNALSNLFGVILTGVNTFTGNSTYGLYIESRGAVTLATVTATLNTTGVYIDNGFAGPTAAKPVTLTGVNNFSSNLAGLFISSNGIVTASNVTASSNLGGTGVIVDNSGATTTPAAVNFTGTNVFNDNTNGNGLLVISDGLVTLNNVTTNGNAFSGLDINNSTGSAGVTLTGINTFSANGDNGVTILSTGAVNLTKVSADSNGQSGLVAVTTNTFTLTCGDFTDNGQYGWGVSNATIAKLIGVFSSVSNSSGPSITSGVGSVIKVRNCPLP